MVRYYTLLLMRSPLTPGPGEIEVYIDGRSVIRAVGLILRDSEAPTSCVQGMHFQTFFGGTFWLLWMEHF